MEKDFIIDKKDKKVVQKRRVKKSLEERFEEFYGKDIEMIIKEHADDFKCEEIDWDRLSEKNFGNVIQFESTRC